MLQVRNLGKRYGTEPVFSQVDLDVSPGEFIAIVGESGVGKSTLLNCLAGLDTVSEGTVRVLDTPITQLDDQAQALFRRQHLGFVFQAFHVLPHLDVAQNVALPLMLLGQPDPARVLAALNAVGLSGLGARLPQQLSGGQLQRVAIARALIHRPALILADEPTGNLDPETADRIMTALVAQTRAHGAACVMVTHSHSAAQRADRILRLTRTGLKDDRLQDGL
ncbi:MAG: ABC transporter ATP-binding protein [Aquabacterium sp.]|uniref:ABC transporter ATP-binding protein n=1 Tax=Aquabacterium sp. TaxID=1872578 RepID=UPI001211AC8E|nr:ABC transporter ATP-binding protein [Aquabacterium sp.]TAK91164.1 MAG: ABC transporter ATP-binding protein [Aquabacterium sp.]